MLPLPGTRREKRHVIPICLWSRSHHRSRHAQDIYRSQRRKGPLFLARHFLVLIATGSLVVLAMGTWWLLPAMILHGFVMAFLFGPVHECSHVTPFRTRWLNSAVYWLLTLIYIVPPSMFPLLRSGQHRYTQIRGSDPDMVLPRNSTVWHYNYYVSALPFWMRGARWMFTLPFGLIGDKERHFIPDTAVPGLKSEGRIILRASTAPLPSSASPSSLGGP